jgi:hypothetical protein
MRARRADSTRRKEHNRNHLAAALLALLALAGCGGRAPPGCTGAVRQLNPDRWQASPNDLVAPPAAQRTASLGNCPAPVLARAARGGAVS